MLEEDARRAAPHTADVARLVRRANVSGDAHSQPKSNAADVALLAA
jgi:hypothetical protein